MGNAKNRYWQEIRGLCMLAVVMMHCPSAASYEIGTVTFKTYICFRQFINFPVAIFIFLSGYFAKKEIVSPSKYYLERAKKLLIPFVIWSVFYDAISIGENMMAGNHISWIRTAVYFLWGQACPPFYYIIALAQLTILTPVLMQIVQKGNRAVKILLWFVTPVYLLVLYICKISIGSKGIPFSTLYAALFPAWFGFYWLGICIRHKREYWEAMANKIAKLSILWISIILCLGESVLWILGDFGVKFAMNQVRYTCHFYTFIIILMLLVVIVIATVVIYEWDSVSNII